MTISPRVTARPPIRWFVSLLATLISTFAQAAALKVDISGVDGALAASGAGSTSDEIARQAGLDELRIETGNSLDEA